jgi:hypothetical protein
MVDGGPAEMGEIGHADVRGMLRIAVGRPLAPQRATCSPALKTRFGHNQTLVTVSYGVGYLATHTPGSFRWDRSWAPQARPNSDWSSTSSRTNSYPPIPSSSQDHDHLSSMRRAGQRRHMAHSLYRPTPLRL